MTEEEYKSKEYSLKPNSKKGSNKELCIICSEKATHFIRGKPENCYCQECAEEFFQIEDLDKF